MHKQLVSACAVVVAGIIFAALNPAARKVLADSANYYLWGGSSNQNSALTGDGNVELGGPTGATPFVDFHYGNGVNQDFNTRLINTADGQIEVITASHATGSDVWSRQLIVNNNGVTIGGGIPPSSTGVKHARVGGCSMGTNDNSCYIQVTWAGDPFKDTNYTPTCTAQGSNGSESFSVPEANKTTTSMQIFVSKNAFGNGYAFTSPGFNCIAIHD